MYTLDTNAIIYYVQDDARAVAALEAMYALAVPVYVSVMTEAELFAFADVPQEEAGKIERFLHTVSLIPMDSQIARMTALLRKTYGLKIADSVIAATALFTGTRLVTRNTKDFRKVPNLIVETI